MLKLMIFCYRKPELTREQFSHYWKHEHADLVRQLPGLKRYVQNHAMQAASVEDRTADGVAELWVEDRQALQLLLDSPECRAALDSADNFFENMTTMLVEEYPVAV